MRTCVSPPGRVAAVAVLVLTLVSGCGFTKSPMCSLVGAIPGVTFEVPAALVPDAAGSSVGEVVFDARTSVDVTLYEPNGSGCEPHVFAGSVRGTTDGRLEAIARHA